MLSSLEIEMQFTKMHGAGNDYIYIDATDSVEKNWSSISIAMSDRHVGIGSDGLILAMLSEKSDIKMTMFNADGSEGQMCGNGIRCLVAFAMERGIIPKKQTQVEVETLSGTRSVHPILENGIFTKAKVGMGKPILSANEIPVNIENLNQVMDHPLEIEDYNFSINCVSIGNPHAVAFVDTPVSQIPLDIIGPIVENHPMFPNRINFEIVNLINRNQLEARVWERGSGETMACGSGACAISVISHLKGFSDNRVSISLPGGNLNVEWDGMNEIILEGPVVKVFDGEWPE